MNAAERQYTPLSTRDLKYMTVRKIKLSTSLNPAYNSLRKLFRTLAEDYAVLRRDASNLALLHALRWANDRFSFECPPLHNKLFYRKCFMLAAARCRDGVPAPNIRQEVQWGLDLWHTFENSFLPVTRGYDYPQWQPVFLDVADDYATKVHTNAILHLGGNFQKYMVRTWEAFLRSFVSRHQVQLPRTAKALGKDAVSKVLHYEEFNAANWEGVAGDIE
ncbi:uncharacterized protein BYT42DRAFT_617252 [Radiomyces spectabilis]|uniref:uncharacterized protein n=1 Tax=Radiomyces spectabilis TaxID=64574 RepID=UPI00221F44DB|nr:uncharacterized protein BYT42DRAFT_617252 [Radiomyces spectabilis]KAI8370735.1 hypothetical protein BYT42DRAFT_617252 [Radiomyces spectabilis]